MTTLDNAERDLLDSDIVITNGNEPIALGGVMGGTSQKLLIKHAMLLSKVRSLIQYLFVILLVV